MSTISITDLKKAYSQSVISAQMSIELCYSRKTILVRPLKVKDKKELLKSIESKNEIIVNSVLDDIIMKYVELPDGGEFNPKELTTQERQQILVYIRVANGEEECKIAHQCPKCEFVNKNISFKTDSLNLKFYEGDGENAKINIKNGDNQLVLELGVVTRSDEIQSEEYIKKNKLKTMTDKQFAILAAVIKNVYIKIGGGEPQKVDFKDIGEKVSFMDNLTSNDLKVITDYVESLEFGVTLPFSFTCTNCEHTSQEEVNVAVFFIS
jgi:hypothetical protein